jgi:hypothetical protein
MTNMGEASQPAPKKKGPFSGCLGIFMIFIVLAIVLVIVSNVIANDAATAKASASASPEAAVSVDSATVNKVKNACEAQLKAVAANSGRKIANVEPKPYEVVSVTFTGDVEEVALPYKEVAWEVPLSVTNKFPNGSTSTDTETCRFRKLQQDAQMLNQ